MKKFEKRYFTLLSLLLLIVLTLASCAVDETDKKPDSGEQAATDNFIMESGSQVYIVLDEGYSLTDDLYTAILDVTGKSPLIADSSTAAGNHEIVIGKVESRSVSNKSYRQLRNMNLQDKGAVYAGYAIYSDGNSIGIAFDYDVALDVALEVLINEILVPGSDGRVKMDADTNVSDFFDLKEKYAELSNRIRNDEYEALKNRIDTLGYDGDAIVAAVKKLYSLYSPDAYVWLANLYDPDIGGFYYSVSARETVGFLPDIESTNQALNFIANTGMQSNLNANLPEDIKKQIVSFVQGLQSSEDGYFYHPQWAEMVTTDSRRGRDLTWAENILSRFGAKPLYDTPNGKKGTLGAPGQNSDAALTASLAIPVSALVSKVTPVAADYLESDAAFLEYLNSFDWASGSYEPGNTIAAQARQIKNAGRMDVCINFLNGLQDPETGMFESFTPGYSDEAVNGFLKVSAVYIEGGYAIPNAKNAAKTCIDTLTSDAPAGTVCWVYNVWYALGNIMGSLKGAEATDDDRALADSIRDELLTNAAEYIEIGAEKYAPFRKEDGSFSFTPNQTSSLSQGMPVAIQGMNEGDVNATNISIAGIAGYLFDALGLRDYQPSIYTKYDWYQFEELLSSMGTIIKTRFNMYNAADFEDMEIDVDDVFGSYNCAELGAEPETVENKKYAYAYITEDNNNRVFHFGKTEEGAEAYVGKVATGFSGKKYTLQLKMKYLGGTASSTDPWNARLAMYYDGGRFWTVCFYPLADGRLAVGSKSAPVAILEQSTWYTLTFEYFAEENVCHFYANGTHIGKAGTVDTSKNDNGYARALFELKNQSTSSFYFDDILVKKEKEDYVEPPIEIGDATGDFYKNAENKGVRKDYDAMFATAPAVTSGAASATTQLENGNLVFKKIDGNNESYLQYNVGADSSLITPILIFETDIKFSNLTQPSFGKIRLYSKDKEITFTTTLKDGIVTIGPVSGKNSLGKKLEIPVEQWHNVRFEVDYTSCEIHVFLDNAHVTTYTNVAFTNASGSRKILLYLYKAETQGAILMDNLFYGLVEDGSFETVLPDDSDEPVTPEIVLPPAVSGTENNGKGAYYSGTTAGISGVTKDYSSGSAPTLELWPTNRAASAVAEIADGILKYYKTNTDNEEYFRQSYTAPSTTLTNGVAIWEADIQFGNAEAGTLGRFTICINKLEVVIGLHVGADGKLYFGTEHNVWADSPALDAGKWYNVRFEYYYHETTKSGATGVVEVYLNNEFACTMTGVGVNARSSWTDIRNLMYLAGPQKSAYLFFDNLYLGFADMQRTPDPEVTPDTPGDENDPTANNGKGAYYTGALTGTNLIKNDFTSGTAPALQLWPTDRTPNAVAEITDGMLKFYKTATDYEEYFLYSGDIPADLVKGVAIWEADVSFGDAAAGVIGRMTICANGLELVVGIHAGEDGKIYLGAEKAAAENSPAFEAGKWYNIRLEYAYHEAAAGNTNTVDLYVNNEFACTMTGIGVTARSWTNARNLYYLAKEQEKAYFYIDNYYFGFIDENVAVEPEEPEAPVTNKGTGVYYNDKSVDGDRYSYDEADAVAPTIGDGASHCTSEISDGVAVFKKITNDGESYLKFSKGGQNWDADNYCTVIEFDYKLDTETAITTYYHHRFRLDSSDYLDLYLNSDTETYSIGAKDTAAIEVGKWHNVRFEIYFITDSINGNREYAKVYIDNEYATTKQLATASGYNGRLLVYLAQQITVDTTVVNIDNMFFGHMDKAYVEETTN